MIAGPPRQDDENVQAGGDAPEGRWFGNIPTPCAAAMPCEARVGEIIFNGPSLAS